LFAGLSTESFVSGDVEEVAGYAEAVNLVFDVYETIPLSENHIASFINSY
jgi:hypothetical protein